MILHYVKHTLFCIYHLLILQNVFGSDTTHCIDMDILNKLLFFENKLIYPCLNSVAAYNLMLVNTQFGPLIKEHKKNNIDTFNKQYPPTWFHIDQASTFTKGIKFKKRNTHSLLINHNSEKILINPSTVLFDLSGNYAKGHSTDLGKEENQYTFHYPSYRVINIKSCTIYIEENTIFDAAPNITRTFCFLVIRASYIGTDENPNALIYTNNTAVTIVNYNSRISLHFPYCLDSLNWYCSRISKITLQPDNTLYIERSMQTSYRNKKATISNKGVAYHLS